MSEESNASESTPLFDGAPVPESETGDIGSMDTPVAEPEEVEQEVVPETKETETKTEEK